MISIEYVLKANYKDINSEIFKYVTDTIHISKYGEITSFFTFLVCFK